MKIFFRLLSQNDIVMPGEPTSLTYYCCIAVFTVRLEMIFLGSREVRLGRSVGGGKCQRAEGSSAACDW